MNPGVYYIISNEANSRRSIFNLSVESDRAYNGHDDVSPDAMDIHVDTIPASLQNLGGVSHLSWIHNIQKLRRPWRRALTLCIVVSAFRAAGRRYSRATRSKGSNASSIQVFDSYMSQAKTRRPLTESERQTVAAKRKFGMVCEDCRKRKVRVRIIHHA